MVAELAMSDALAVCDKFFQLVPSVSEKNRTKVLATFVFMNWTFASGVWSNLPNRKMRRDLQIELKNGVLLKLARTLSGSSVPADVAARAVALTEAFNAYVEVYNSKIRSIGDADSRIATLFALEQIQTICNLTDDALSAVVPQLVTEEGLAANVESLASEVNNVAPPRRDGFFGRLFGVR
jgi:hypothetical protein